MYGGLPIDEIKFVVGGPRQSGKTTLLYTLATVLSRKLQLSADRSQYLLFPMNFELESVHLANHVRLLRLFITTAFQALEYSSLRIVPYLEALHRWFVLTVFGSTIAPVQPLIRDNFVKLDPLLELATSLAKLLISNADHTLEQFVEKLCAFPREFAVALGLKGVVFVFDAFEFASWEFVAGPELFPRSLRPVYFTDALCAEMNKSPYLVSMQSEANFLKMFSSPDGIYVGTEHLLDPKEEVVLRVRDPSLAITVADCRGCPGYIARFGHVCDLVRTRVAREAHPSRYGTIETSPDDSRSSVIRDELVRLLSLLVDAKSDRFSDEQLGLLSDVTDLDVRVEKIPEQEAPKKGK
jgi:hypothetical protein